MLSTRLLAAHSLSLCEGSNVEDGFRNGGVMKAVGDGKNAVHELQCDRFIAMLSSSTFLQLMHVHFIQRGGGVYIC